MNPFEEGTAGKILRYLEKNPDAMDTDRGIAEWWIGTGLKQVQAALPLLVEKKILKTHVINEQVYYFLNLKNED